MYSEDSNITRYLLIGAGFVVAGAALYFLSKDGEMVEYDKNVHTLSKLQNIVHEVYVS